jgi:hypothetical protein
VFHTKGVILIVGLKKRRNSKKVYTLAVVELEETLNHTVELKIDKAKYTTLYKWVPREINRKVHRYLVRSFDRLNLKWAEYRRWVPDYLVEKICDNTEPGKCSNQELVSCPYRFKCLTTKLSEYVQ